MSRILQRGETGFGILIERDAGYITKDLNENIFLNENFEIKPNEPVLINCVLQKWGVENKNGRIYPMEVLLQQIEEYKKLVETNSAISEADHPDCVLASESKILTETGWKSFEDILNDENILTLNIKTNKIEIQQISKKIYEDYTGEMYNIKNNNVEITVTPNHKLLIECPNGDRKYISAKDFYINKDKYLKSGEYKLLKSGEWKDNNTNQYFNIPKQKNIYIDENSFLIEKINVNDEKIACVTVPNSNFYVMVNGKVHWTGNSSVVSLHNVSHVIKKMWWGSGDEENVLYGQLEIITSPAYMRDGIVTMIGDKIVEYLKRGIKLGISSRGVGTLKEVNGKNVVQSDFELICFDLVGTPSTPGAYLFPNKNELQVGENTMKDGEIINEDKKLLINNLNKFLLN